MNLLAFDTSSIACSVALLTLHGITYEYVEKPNQHAKLLLPFIDQLLAKANLTLQDLDAIVVGVGPGSFTGIRIGVSVANALSLALRKPLIGISSLKAFAQYVYEQTGYGKLLVAVDARLETVYFGSYNVVRTLMTLEDTEKVISPENIVMGGEDDIYAIGNGWQVYENKIKGKPKRITHINFPHAKGLLALALDEYKNASFAHGVSIPIYLRNDIAVKKDKG